MAAFHQHVGRQSQLMARSRGPNGAVIADTNNRMAWGALEKAFNEVKFTHVSELNRMTCGMSAMASMQSTPDRAAARGVQNKLANGRIKAVTIFGHEKIAAVHGATGRAQTAGAGVLKRLARPQQRLLAYHTQTLDLVAVPFFILDDPMA